MKKRITEYYWIATWSSIGLVMIYAMVLRAYIAWDLPLWLDESWTAVLSSAPDLPTFTRYMWLDSNAPLYYVLIWLWPFESNFGLRVPSFIFMLATAAVAIIWRPNGVRRGTAVFWAALLLLLWKPGTGLFIDARYYALLLLISTAQTIAFMKLLDEPSLKRACWWTGLATLGVLTHYYAALPALVQGLFYLGRHRTVALRTWPALMLLAPAVAWAAFHWPRLVMYARARRHLVFLRQAGGCAGPSVLADRRKLEDRNRRRRPGRVVPDKGTPSTKRGHDHIGGDRDDSGLRPGRISVARGHGAILDPDHTAHAARRRGAGQAGWLPSAHRIVFPEHGRRIGIGA